MKYVLAGNKEEFLDYCNKEGLKHIEEAIFLMNFKGIAMPHIYPEDLIFVGAWKDNPWYTDDYLAELDYTVIGNINLVKLKNS